MGPLISAFNFCFLIIVVAVNLPGITHGQSTTSVCFNVFRQNMTSVTTGATAKPEYPDQVSCEAACNADPLCNSYQIATTGVVCWFQYNPINLNAAWAAPGVYEKIKYQNCTSTIATCQYTANSTYASVGATPRPDLTTQFACEGACTLDPLCLSYQTSLIVGSTYCWLQYASGMLGRPVTGITEYIKYCLNTTTATTTTATTTTATTTITLLAVTTKAPIVVCTTYRFITNYTNWCSDGATQYSSYVSQSYCEAACLWSSRYCYTYQYHASSRCCSLQYNSVLNYIYRPGYYEYVKKCVQVACTISFVTNSTMVSSAATPYQQYTTKSACEYACTIDTTCVSYQINTNYDRISYCWLNFRSVDPTKLINNPGVTEYFRNCT